MEDHLRKTVEPPQIQSTDRLNEHPHCIKHLIAERIRYQDEQRQREMESSVPVVVSFRIPAAMIDVLVGEEDQRSHLIAYATQTELFLPRHFQSSTFTISGYDHNIRRALRMIEKIINEECCNSDSSNYTFIADPNVEESGTDYILCNGPIREARYRLGREGMHRG
ncbi:unnamed protein product [Cercopithifilaria johnstoni]|uniref:K Homology domain-containing protein n=1 Tax=Cercopithifilaria johnstoni TaxID=2874296 RepID=A0A8J2M787_9BILA|nr:unnamed protein product [Cercopithifilaria johnstoni]